MKVNHVGKHILGFIIQPIKSARVELVDTIIDCWTVKKNTYNNPICFLC